MARKPAPGGQRPGAAVKPPMGGGVKCKGLRDSPKTALEPGADVMEVTAYTEATKFTVSK